jgi:MFS family permease
MVMAKKQGIDHKVLFSCILMFSIGFEMGGFQAVLREMSAYFFLGKISRGLLVSSQYAGIIIMPAIFGRVADRFGKKRVLSVFMVLFSLGTLTVGTSFWFPLTIFSFFLIGAGYGVAESVCTALLSDQYGLQADRYMNLSQAFLCIGAVVAPIFASLMHPHWRLVFIVSSAICLISLVMLFFESGFVVVLSSPTSKFLDFSLFRSKIFVLLFFSMLLYVGLENGFGYFTESFFFESYSSSLGAYTISLYWAFMALSRLLSSLSSRNLYQQLCFRFFLIGLIFIALYSSKSPLFYIVLCAAIGFCYGPIWANIMSISAGRYPGKTASVIGLISSSSGLGGSLYPVCMSVVITYTTKGNGFIFLAVSSLFAFILIYLASVFTRFERKMDAPVR